MCGIWAASSKALMPETSTASLVRTSSRNECLPMLPAPVRSHARRPLLQIGNELGFAPSARHRVEDETRNDRQKGQQHETGSENGRRNPRNDSLLEIRHENRDREHNRN